MIDPQPPPEIDRTTIASVVEGLLGPGHAIGSWTIAPVAGPHLGLAGGPFRLTGRASAGTATHEWSVVLKILRPVPASFIERFAPADQ